MPVTAEVDMSRFSQVMGDLMDAMAGQGQDSDAREIVRQQAKLLVKQIIKFTPPQSKAQGEGAVQHELNSLISEADQKTIDHIANDQGTENINTYLTLHDDTKEHLKWEHMLVAENETLLKQLHYKYKDQLGKVAKKKPQPGTWAARIVVPLGNKQTYIDLMKSHVGRWKASWLKLAESLGLKAESWVSRHMPSPNAIGDDSGLHEGTFPVVVIGSRAPGIGRQKRIIDEAKRVRIEAMSRNVRLIMSGYADDVWRGMRVKSRAKRQAYHEAHPENDYGNSGIAG